MDLILNEIDIMRQINSEYIIKFMDVFETEE